MNIDPVVNTLRASWFTLVLADFFGKEVIKYEADKRIVLKVFRGVTYFIDYTYKQDNPNGHT